MFVDEALVSGLSIMFVNEPLVSCLSLMFVDEALCVRPFDNVC